MADDTSNRRRKEAARAGLRALQARPGWNPSSTETASERLEAALAHDRADRLYEKAADCEACAEARRELGDPTALCDDHLAAALG